MEAANLRSYGRFASRLGRRGERDVGEVMALADHLSADQGLSLPSPEPGKDAHELALLSGRITIEYIDGNVSKGGKLTPRLVGFLNEVEREFFELICTVDGVGCFKNRSR